jgi:PAS domain S-box-containing protein
MAFTSDTGHFVAPEFLQGGGELGQRMRDYDWSKTTLGAVNTWPQSLRTVVSICLNSNFPIAIYWGKDLTLLYNDAWSSIPGNKHPWALGRTAKEVWPDIWEAIESQFEKAFDGEPGGSKDALLPMRRHGYTEECYFDFTFTSVYGEEGRVEGVFNAVIETTYRVINERRTAFLKDLAINITDSHSKKELFTETINFIRSFPQDIPFALLYTVNDHKLELEASTLPAKESDVLKNSLSLSKIMESDKPVCFNNLKEYLEKLPHNYWPEEITQAYAMPIIETNGSMVGLLVCGLSARRHFDEEYKVFLESIGSTVTNVSQAINALEEERKRAEALAEIDKAKTTFFSNISHEFRTPLTLLLGPVEDALNDPDTIPANKARLDVAFRNALRMQKLVNTLLDFSRIEARRMEGKFSRVDICPFTQELASTFRSAIEKAGMQLVFDCAKIKSEVYADTDMWEKIVLNLISNAFKYSTEGTIIVRIKEVENQIQLSVSDTGTGIPPDQLDKIFDRFYRVENIRGRSQEGTGIGLAMVKELVRVHQGTIAVESKVGEGSIFTVTIPAGKEHLSENKIVEATASTSGYADAFVQEAMKWNANEKNNEIIDDIFLDTLSEKKQIKKYKVLLADDNADMREYVKRILSDQFKVITAVDGEDAFTKLLQESPDLILSDIMMSKLDGFGLLANIRNHPDHKNLPVILLSARAGEEARVEGLDAGANDYLVKPFSAKELLARIDANIKIAKNRIAAESNLREMIRQSPVATVLLKGRSMTIEIVNEKALEIWGRSHTEVINRPIAEALPEIREQGFDKLLEQVYDTGTSFNGNEVPVQLMRFGKSELIFLNFIYQPLKNEQDETVGIIGVGIDVTEQVVARKKTEQNERALNELANSVPQLVWMANAEGEVLYYNNRVNEFAGASIKKDGSWAWEGLVHPEDLIATEKAWTDAVKNGTVYQVEHRVQMKNGEYRWFLSRAFPHKDDSGRILKWFGTATDIHTGKMQATILEEKVKKRTKELNELNLSLIQSNNELQQFAHVASHDLKEPLRKIRTFAGMLGGDIESSFSDKGKLYLGKINAAANRMGIMIEGVLTYSMLSAIHQKIEKVDLCEVFRSIESDLEVLIDQKSAKISYHHLPVIEGASVLIYQLFYNLINNSLKFSKPDQLPLIEISSSVLQLEQKEFVAIKISDNGIGFEQDLAEKIFQTFLRLNSKDMFEGTGLGLSLCKRIAERHGGFIEAIGEPDKGASFVTYLPLEQQGGSI